MFFETSLIYLEHPFNFISLFGYLWEYPTVINLFVYSRLHFIDCFVLLAYEPFFFCDVHLDFVNDEVLCAHFFLAHFFNQWNHVLSVSGSNCKNSYVFAPLNKVLDASLCLIAHFDSVRPRKVENLLTFVQVNKMCNVTVSNLMNNLPSIILGDGNAIKLHVFRSKSF